VISRSIRKRQQDFYDIGARGQAALVRVVRRGTLKTRDIRIAGRNLIARLGYGNNGGIEASVDACKLLATPERAEASIPPEEI
jgi:hypothetical protein